MDKQPPPLGVRFAPPAGSYGPNGPSPAPLALPTRHPRPCGLCPTGIHQLNQAPHAGQNWAQIHTRKPNHEQRNGTSTAPMS